MQPDGDRRHPVSGQGYTEQRSWSVHAVEGPSSLTCQSDCKVDTPVQVQSFQFHSRFHFHFQSHHRAYHRLFCSTPCQRISLCSVQLPVYLFLYLLLV